MNFSFISKHFYFVFPWSLLKMYSLFSYIGGVYSGSDSMENEDDFKPPPPNYPPPPPSDYPKHFTYSIYESDWVQPVTKLVPTKSKFNVLTYHNDGKICFQGKELTDKCLFLSLVKWIEITGVKSFKSWVTEYIGISEKAWNLSELEFIVSYCNQLHNNFVEFNATTEQLQSFDIKGKDMDNYDTDTSDILEAYFRDINSRLVIYSNKDELGYDFGGELKKRGLKQTFVDFESARNSYAPTVGNIKSHLTCKIINYGNAHYELLY